MQKLEARLHNGSRNCKTHDCVEKKPPALCVLEAEQEEGETELNERDAPVPEQLGNEEKLERDSAPTEGDEASSAA